MTIGISISNNTYRQHASKSPNLGTRQFIGVFHYRGTLKKGNNEVDQLCVYGVQYLEVSSLNFEFGKFQSLIFVNDIRISSQYPKDCKPCFHILEAGKHYLESSKFYNAL